MSEINNLDSLETMDDMDLQNPEVRIMIDKIFDNFRLSCPSDIYQMKTRYNKKRELFEVFLKFDDGSTLYFNCEVGSIAYEKIKSSEPMNLGIFKKGGPLMHQHCVDSLKKLEEKLGAEIDHLDTMKPERFAMLKLVIDYFLMYQWKLKNIKATRAYGLYPEYSIGIMSLILGKPLMTLDELRSSSGMMFKVPMTEEEVEALFFLK